MRKLQVTIPTVHNERLKGFILGDGSFSGKRPAILVIHGWMSNAQRYIDRVVPLTKIGYLCLLFDMRGHGETGYDLSKYSRKDHLDDCLAAYDYLAKFDQVDVDNITVLGSSYGGYLAALVSQKRQVARLVLIAPAQYQDELFDQPKQDLDEVELREYRLQHHGIQQQHALKAACDFTGSILLIQPENDERLPAQVSNDWLKAGGDKITHVIIKGADHSFRKAGANERMISEVVDWIEN